MWKNSQNVKTREPTWKVGTTQPCISISVTKGCVAVIPDRGHASHTSITKPASYPFTSQVRLIDPFNGKTCLFSWNENSSKFWLPCQESNPYGPRRSNGNRMNYRDCLPSWSKNYREPCRVRNYHDCQAHQNVWLNNLFSIRGCVDMFCGLRQHSGLTIYIQLSIGKVSKRPAERKCIRKTTVAEWAHNVRCLQPPYGRQKNREVHQWFLTETEGEIPDKSSISKLLATLIYESPRKLSISFLKKQDIKMQVQKGNSPEIPN